MVFGYSFLSMAWDELFVNRPVGGYSNNIILDFLVLKLCFSLRRKSNLVHLIIYDIFA